MNMSNLHGDTFTIINVIPNGESNKYAKHVLQKCGKDDGIFDRSAGTMAYKKDSWTAYICDTEKYIPPCDYYGSDNINSKFTVNVGDLLIFKIISEDAPKNTKEFINLRDKYKSCGGVITGQRTYLSYNADGTPWTTNYIEVVKE